MTLRWMAALFVATAIVLASWRARDDARTAAVTANQAALAVAQSSIEIIQLRTSIAAVRSSIQTQLTTCRRRTQSLREVMEVMILDGKCFRDRVRLPDPAPGWAAWPVPGPEYGLTADQEAGLP